MAPMAAQTATELATLRALTFRISSTPAAQLPQHVPAIASSLATCRSLLSSAQASSSKTAPEASVAIHKYRTLLSTLLQDRTIQGRWAAIVLIKSTVEIGGWETLQKSLPWVRGLLGILTKPDPPSSKQLCIITLTRIFTLTREYPTLVREITTPSLSPFIQSALQVAASRIPPTLLGTVLESFHQILPRHPTTFRSHLKQIQQLLSQTIAPTPSSKLSPEQVPGSRPTLSLAASEAARRLYTQLPCSASKGATSEEWQEAFSKTLANVHRVGDRVFRAVVEDWKSSTRDTDATNGHAVDDEVQDLNADSMGFPPWSGIFAGGERLTGLMSLVKAYLLCPTNGSINLNIRAVVDLLTRLLSLTIPSSKSHGFQNVIRFNNQISKEERENLWLILPKVHVAAIDILLALMRRSDSSTIAIDTAMLDQLVWVFAAEKDYPEVRTSCYTTVRELLLRSGDTLPKPSVEPLGDMIRNCCHDIVALEESNVPSKQSPALPKVNGNHQATTNADAFLNTFKAKHSHVSFRGLHAAAHSLLPVLFSHIQPQHLTVSLRTRMDRTAVLVGDKNGMMASVLNPPSTKKFGASAVSILPFLARHHAGEKEVEALLRPRMPAIRTGHDDSEDVDVDEAEEEEPEDVQRDEEFISNELNTPLEMAEDTHGVRGDAALEDIASMDRTALAANTEPSKHADGHFESTTAIPKRSLEHTGPISSPKRMKINEEQGFSTTVPTLVDPLPTAVHTSIVDSAVEAPEAMTSLPVISQIQAPSMAVPPPAAFPTTAELGEEESDDEDIVPLVLGQDTDSESE